MPTITVILQRLDDIHASGTLTICFPLLKTLKESIHKRFCYHMEEMDCLLAAAFHPQFKLAWLSSSAEDLKYEVTEKMISLLEARTSNEDSSLSEEDTDKDDFFGHIYFLKEKKSSSRASVQSFLQETPQKKNFIDAFPNSQFRDLFIHYNTAISSSAAVESFFDGKIHFETKKSRS